MAGLGLYKNHVLNTLVEELLRRISSSTEKIHEGKVTYVIGNNGTGKSLILGELAKRLRDAPAVMTVACIANALYDRFTFGDHARVIYLGARNAPNAVFQSASERQLSRFILQAMLINRSLFTELCGATNMDLSFSIEKEAIENLMHPGSSKRDRERLFEKAQELKLLNARPLGMLRRIADGTGRFEQLTSAQIPVLLRFLELSVKFDLIVTLRDGRTTSFGSLSTGEQSRMLLFAKILSVMKEGTVFLIDEPEISLHLHWQMKFHETVMRLLSKLKRFHIVVATHAPIVISEAAKADPGNEHNMVAVLRHSVSEGEQESDLGPGIRKMTCEKHSFSNVASHDQLVLRYFYTAPYQAREVSVEIADTVLSVAEKSKRPREAISLLNNLLSVEGLTDEAKTQIETAIGLVREGMPTFIERSESR
ncbi:AAA family ATPase [Pectobacterium aroidearum]|uniref:AAA family ATPase n=1 Tax=Pectobacterium aroidearum TaxID=1201031 RepID=UPI003315D621